MGGRKWISKDSTESAGNVRSALPKWQRHYLKLLPNDQYDERARLHRARRTLRRVGIWGRHVFRRRQEQFFGLRIKGHRLRARLRRERFRLVNIRRFLGKDSERAVATRREHGLRRRIEFCPIDSRADREVRDDLP